ncbi:zf-UBP-domain-containing protein [Thelephora terrestris]|uniref:Zf-UBP-domain-containing protein n=1 Tax=Thelephora terrestris TaxID=56493 RepID=A0A9P6HIT8_9AGAM|nr:zf-UBP-domain-containing protein [Thelephora terrestris]
MRGYHIRIRVTVKPATKSPAKATTWAADTFIPKSVFENLPAHTPRETSRNNAILGSKRRDYRYGPIRIDWLDLKSSPPTTSSIEKPLKKPKGGIERVTMDNAPTMSASGNGKEKDTRNRSGPIVGKFVPKPDKTKVEDCPDQPHGSTNLPEGIVHIFRDPPPRANVGTQDESLTNDENNTELGADDNTLAVLAVPSWMTPADFLSFVEPAADSIVHLRMIRDSVPNRSMVFIRFRDSTSPGEFVEAYNGKAFNSLEPEICHVVRVLSITIDTEDAASTSIARFATSYESMVYELPTCPVCLERMDSAVTGLVTVPCSHTFHCMCLSKWGDSRCPVCRYSQTLLSSHPTSSNTARPSSLAVPFSNPNPSSSPQLSRCADCGSNSNLWICLICGNIGCGRYGRAHAQAHYQSTTHLYALELETQRVWDYAGDGYVHRLIQNKADGKLVELPSAATSSAAGGREGSGMGPGPSDTLTAEKIEAIGIEYSYLLTSQLDSQRSFYEDRVNELAAAVNELKGLVTRFSTEAEEAKKRGAEEAKKRKAEEEARIAELERDKEKAEKKAERLTALSRRLEKELKEERACGEGLMQNLQNLKGKLEGAEQQKRESQARIEELQDQVKDIMFYMEAQSKIAGEGSELAGGSIEVRPDPKKKKSGRK